VKEDLDRQVIVLDKRRNVLSLGRRSQAAKYMRLGCHALNAKGHSTHHQEEKSIPAGVSKR